jgi:DNA-binding response OmpR family regulator
MKHVLLVEDAADLRELLGHVLGEDGYRVSLAGTVAAARSVLARGGVDLLVTDIVLPDGRGIELGEEATARGMPLLAITGHPDAMRGLDREGRAYLAKPFRPGQFLRRVAELIGAAEAV